MIVVARDAVNGSGTAIALADRQTTQNLEANDAEATMKTRTNVKAGGSGVKR